MAVSESESQATSSGNAVQRQNAKIFMDLLNIEQKKAQKLEDMINSLQTESTKKEQAYFSEMQKLKQGESSHFTSKQNMKSAAVTGDRLETRYKSLQLINADISSKINATCEADGAAREKLKVYIELKYWRQKYNDLAAQSHTRTHIQPQNNEQIKKLEQELEHYKKSAKKYKSSYLKLKAERGLDQFATMRTSLEPSPENGKDAAISSQRSPPNRSVDEGLESFKASGANEFMIQRRDMARKKPANNHINIV